jgi:hypothetical protein
VTGPGHELDPPGCLRLADSGVYLLGALPSPEHADYAAHLNKCTDCQREVEQLAHLPALLNRITTGPDLTSPARSEGEERGRCLPEWGSERGRASR